MLSFKGQSAQMQQQMISFHLAQIRWFVFFCTSQLHMVSFFQKLKTEPLNSTRCMCGTSLLWNGSHCVCFYWRRLPCVSTLSPDIFVHTRFLSLPDAGAQRHNSTESRSVKQRVRNRNQIIQCIFKLKKKNKLHVYVITGEARPEVNKSEVYQRVADTSWRCKTTKLFYYYSPFSKDYSKKTDQQVTAQ